MKKVAPIRTHEAHEAALEWAAELMRASDSASLDKLDVLTAVIERGERNRYKIEPPTVKSMVRASEWFLNSVIRLRPKI